MDIVVGVYYNAIDAIASRDVKIIRNIVVTEIWECDFFQNKFTDVANNHTNISFSSDTEMTISFILVNNECETNNCLINQLMQLLLLIIRHHCSSHHFIVIQIRSVSEYNLSGEFADIIQGVMNSFPNLSNTIIAYSTSNLQEVASDGGLSFISQLVTTIQQHYNTLSIPEMLDMMKSVNDVGSKVQYKVFPFVSSQSIYFPVSKIRSEMIEWFSYHSHIYDDWWQVIETVVDFLLLNKQFNTTLKIAYVYGLHDDRFLEDFNQYLHSNSSVVSDAAILTHINSLLHGYVIVPTCFGIKYALRIVYLSYIQSRDVEVFRLYRHTINTCLQGVIGYLYSDDAKVDRFCISSIITEQLIDILHSPFLTTNIVHCRMMIEISQLMYHKMHMKMRRNDKLFDAISYALHAISTVTRVASAVDTNLSQSLMRYEVGVNENRPNIIGRALIFSFESYNITTSGDRATDEIVSDDTRNFTTHVNDDGDDHHNDEMLSERIGSDINRQQLTLLLELMGFDVYMHVDQTADQIRQIVADFATKEDNRYGLFMFIVMSHGVYSDDASVTNTNNSGYKADDMFYAYDRQVLSLYDDIISPLNNSVYLRNVVKMYVVNICRENHTTSVDVGCSRNIAVASGKSSAEDAMSKDTIYKSQESISQEQVQVNNLLGQSHCMIVHSTLPSHYAYRTTHQGALAIDAFVRAMSTHRKHDFLTIIQEMNDNLRDICMNEFQLFQAVAVELYDIRRKIYLQANTNLTIKDWLLEGCLVQSLPVTESYDILTYIHRFVRILCHHGYKDMASLSCYAVGLSVCDLQQLDHNMSIIQVKLLLNILQCNVVVSTKYGLKYAMRYAYNILLMIKMESSGNGRDEVNVGEQSFPTTLPCTIASNNNIIKTSDRVSGEQNSVGVIITDDTAIMSLLITVIDALLSYFNVYGCFYDVDMFLQLETIVLTRSIIANNSYLCEHIVHVLLQWYHTCDTLYTDCIVYLIQYIMSRCQLHDDILEKVNSSISKSVFESCKDMIPLKRNSEEVMKMQIWTEELMAISKKKKLIV